MYFNHVITNHFRQQSWCCIYFWQPPRVLLYTSPSPPSYRPRVWQQKARYLLQKCFFFFQFHLNLMQIFNLRLLMQTYQQGKFLMFSFRSSYTVPKKMWPNIGVQIEVSIYEVKVDYLHTKLIYFVVVAKTSMFSVAMYVYYVRCLIHFHFSL